MQKFPLGAATTTCLLSTPRFLGCGRGVFCSSFFLWLFRCIFVDAFEPTSCWLKWLGPRHGELIPQPSREKVGRKVSAPKESSRSRRCTHKTDRGPKTIRYFIQEQTVNWLEVWAVVTHFHTPKRKNFRSKVKPGADFRFRVQNSFPTVFAFARKDGPATSSN